MRSKRAARVASALVLLVTLALAGCASGPGTSAGASRGGYYQNDGPDKNPPPGLIDVPDAEAKIEQYSKSANRPYVVFGTSYTPITDEQPFVQRGVGSWYGKKFHGQRTASGELYDMYKMTAAHPTLPIPSYARLTSLVTGKQVIVRINDRGPFHSKRAIDVSYTAALKLGLLGKGSHELKIERLLPVDIERMNAARHGRFALDMPAPAVASVAPPALAERMAPSAEAARPAVDSAGSSPVPKAGYYLQLATFSRAGNAQEMRTRVLQFMGASRTLEVVQAGPVHRLYSGPFASRAEASLAAEALPGTLSLKPIIVQR